MSRSDQSNQAAIRKQILEQAACADRGKLLRMLKKDQPRDKLLNSLSASIDSVQRRRQKRPAAKLDSGLPFFEHRQELAEAIKSQQVVVVCGETGSGKTTQLPQLCIDLGLADFGLIGHTQPRRLAAQSVAARIGSELGVEDSPAVGYKVRFRDRSDPAGYIKLMTDGILLAEIQHDRLLNRYSTLIIDEAHERSLNIDLLLGYIKQILPRRPDLKLIITSATIDPQRFSDYFNGAPIFNISGRTYPVEIRYRGELDVSADRLQPLVDAIEELDGEARGDVLVFFPGERHIREAERFLSRHLQDDSEILPLYARLTQAEQQKIFHGHKKRRIILSTNVAETSLTVPGIKYVIDTGLARLSRYSWRSRVQRLPIEKISQASANQRSGRCGRLGPGICIRLYDEDDFENRPLFTEAEILRSNLASVILQMNELKLGSIHAFDFIDPPDTRLINDGFRLLFELRAADEEERILKHGSQLAAFPIDPRLSQMLMRGARLGCLRELLVIVSVLAIQDPRDQSTENREAANQQQSQWQDKQSDFMFWINLWRDLQDQKKALSRNQFSRWCRKHYLSWIRVSEWNDTWRQLQDLCKQRGLKTNDKEADADTIHRAIFSGIPSHIAHIDQDGAYQATRGRKLSIFPGSKLAAKTPRWLMAFSFIETSRLFAHGCAVFKPDWVMQDAEHLHQYEYVEPFWQEKQGRVAAYRNTRVYGLMVQSRKLVNYAAIDPPLARQIFIREGLVEGLLRTRVKVIQQNRDLLEHFESQENRFRRRDIVISDQQLFDFYDQRLPAATVDGPSFENWINQCSQSEINHLRLRDEDIANTERQGKARDFPNEIICKGESLALEYHFEPGTAQDGVTVQIPLLVLNKFEDADFERLVPGLLLQKIEAMIRGLPRKLRKNFVPVPDFAAACYERLEKEVGLQQSISNTLQAMTGVKPSADDWARLELDTHFHMHYAVLDKGRILASGDSLVSLKSEFAGQGEEAFSAHVSASADWQREGLTSWDLEDVPEVLEVERFGVTVKTYPALVDYQDSVALELLDSSESAAFYHPVGVARLLLFALRDTTRYLNKNLPEFETSALLYSTLGSRQDLFDDVMMSSVSFCFLKHEAPRDLPSFQKLLEEHRSELVSVASEVASLLHQILRLQREVSGQLESAELSNAVYADVENQLGSLVYEGFLRDLSLVRLKRMPVYLQAMTKRIQNVQPDSRQQRDDLHTIQRLENRLHELSEAGADWQAVDEIRWMIEEFRISCFAKPMKAAMPVSEKRILAAMDRVSGDN